MKPMLAAATDGTEICYPVFTSPKLDGVRAVVIDGQVLSRSLKPIPNEHVQQLFGKPELNGLDGELIVGPSTDKSVFQRTTSGVMSIKGKPEVHFHVFDDFTEPDLPFRLRFKRVQARCRNLRKANLTVVNHPMVHTVEELISQEALYIYLGYEGLMIRAPDGLYKYGRSTVKQGWLLKQKRFEDSEAEILGFKELMHNSNEAKVNELGYKTRSSKKEGKLGTGFLGAMVVRDTASGITFDLGTGFDMEQRLNFWMQRDNLLGQLIKYKYQSAGVKEKPRFPVFLGLRDNRDL